MLTFADLLGQKMLTYADLNVINFSRVVVEIGIKVTTKTSPQAEG